MLKSMQLKNFTVFSEADFKFGKHLNVVIGENGSGKSHVLKAAYSVIAVSADINKDIKSSSTPTPVRSRLQQALADKLMGVFRPDGLGRLVRRHIGRSKCSLKYEFEQSQQNLWMTFSTLATTKVTVEKYPDRWVGMPPVFLPTRELLTIYPGFVAIYETTDLPFEETWRDTCLLLEVPFVRGPRTDDIKQLLEPLEEAMDGKVEIQAGRFYLNLASGKGKMEMHLVAEGLRKLATVARLIANGSLLKKGYLFWDEPEANLNPKITKTVARIILQIAGSGIQVFIATHSLFLLRELHILLKRDFGKLDAHFFGLHFDNEGAVRVKQGDTIDDVGDIPALNEELQQSDRYLETELGTTITTETSAAKG